MSTPRYTYLLERCLAGKASEEERQELLAFVRETKEDDPVRDLLARSWEGFVTDEVLPREDADALFHSILQQAEGLHRPPAAIRYITTVRRLAVAAVILLLGVGAWFFFHHNPRQPIAAPPVTPARDLVTAGSSHAVLTLAGGQQIVLDSAGNGSLAMQGNTQVLRLADGRIAYNPNGNETSSKPSAAEAATEPTGSVKASHILYNTLTVPRGSRVASVTLSDGTRVWLNAASSITFPTTFTGKDRPVQLQGEAYLEIAKDESRPFLVTANASTIEVLGTRFNVNAYNDEPALKATLLEGGIRVIKGEDKKVLSPGQQAIIKEDIQIGNKIDLDQVIAWKTGVFNFNRLPLKEAMRQLSRWYDVDVELPAGLANKKFGGEMGRDLSLTQVLKLLNGVDMHFRLEGRKIIVFP